MRGRPSGFLRAAALVAAAAFAGAANVIASGAQTFDSIERASRLSPTRIRRETSRTWSPSHRKGQHTRRTKHNRKQQPRSWRRARAAKLRARRR